MAIDVIDQMDEFTTLVNNASNKKLNLMLHNGSYAHARILFNKILEHATDTVSLISQECTEDFYGQKSVKQSFLSFIERTQGEGKIRIILESQNTEQNLKENSFLKELLFSYKSKGHTDSLEVYSLVDNNSIKISGNLSHMLLVDKGPYRFESHLQTDKSHSELLNTPTDAIANFGDIENSQKLWDFFEIQRTKKSTKASLL